LNTTNNQALKHKKIAIFPTCIVNLMRPSVGIATIKLLEDQGLQVMVPDTQICCGQPGYNNGDKKNTIKNAQKLIQELQPFDYIVIPSGSCAGMIKHHYLELLTDTDWFESAKSVAKKTFELTQFLSNVLGVNALSAANNSQVITIHDSCAGLRELKIKDEPRQLLGLKNGITINEHSQAEVCCGFGGTFCVKYSDVSNQMVTKKTESLLETNADSIVAGDLGCLLNIAGKLSRLGSTVEVKHIAEVLAGNNDTAGIGGTLKDVK